MKYVFTLFSVLFLPILSFKINKPKFCVNCKFFITDNDTGKFGKCSLFPKVEKDIYMLVHGGEDKIMDYKFCYSVRQLDHFCGEKGTMYRKKYVKKGALKGTGIG